MFEGAPATTSARAKLTEHLRDHALRTDGPFTLASGATAEWYLDARQTTFSGRGALLVAQAVLEVLDEEVEAVGGMTMGADPIALATAVMSPRPLMAFSVRKQDKDHGTGGRLVGPVTAGTVVAVVEDTTTTGGALSEAIDVAADHGLGVVQALALVDRSAGRVADLMAQRGVPYRPLVLPSDLGVAP